MQSVRCWHDCVAAKTKTCNWRDIYNVHIGANAAVKSNICNAIDWIAATGITLAGNLDNNVVILNP